MRHTHEKGICHRDLKPENLLLSGDFQLKIADFGLSSLGENEDGTPLLLRTECGTRGYMAPEVLSGKPYDGKKADVWSAGVILFITLAGFPPFQMAANSDWWFQRIRHKQYSLFWEAHLRSATFSPQAMGAWRVACGAWQQWLGLLWCRVHVCVCVCVVCAPVHARVLTLVSVSALGCPSLGCCFHPRAPLPHLAHLAPRLHLTTNHANSLPESHLRRRPRGARQL